MTDANAAKHAGPPAAPPAMSLADLQRMVADVPGLTALERRGGLVLEVAMASARATIALKGAQVLSWTPAGHKDALWCSPLSSFGGDTAIRGGIPVCWPWFGPHPRDRKKPQHGFARNAPWHLVDISDIEDGTGGRMVLTFRLPVAAWAGLSLQPVLFIEVGRTLALRLETENMGDAPATFSEALHTYFRVGDVARVRIDGLDGATYRDNTAGGHPTLQQGALEISRETIALFDTAPAVTNIVDPGLKRCISVRRDPDSRSTVVWNPGAAAASMADIPTGEAAAFVCVESGNIGASAVTLAAGETHACGVSYALEAM